MYEVLDKDTIKIEILKSCHIYRWQNAVMLQKVTSRRSSSVYPLQIENGLSVAYASGFVHLHEDRIELQNRVWTFPRMVYERRIEEGVDHHNIGALQVFLGHVQCGLGR